MIAVFHALREVDGSLDILDTERWDGLLLVWAFFLLLFCVLPTRNGKSRRTKKDEE